MAAVLLCAGISALCATFWLRMALWASAGRRKAASAADEVQAARYEEEAMSYGNGAVVGKRLTVASLSFTALVGVVVGVSALIGRGG